MKIASVKFLGYFTRRSRVVDSFVFEVSPPDWDEKIRLKLDTSPGVLSWADCWREPAEMRALLKKMSDELDKIEQSDQFKALTSKKS